MTPTDKLQSAQRLHPATLVQRLLKSLPALIFLLFFQSAEANKWVTLAIALAYGLVAIPLVLLQYLRFHYWITPQEIVIQRGVLNRRKRSIPIERIQNIATEQSLLPRLLGVAKVTLETAGSTSTEGKLEYVALSTAQEIRRVVRSYQRQHQEQEAPPSTAAAEETANGAPASVTSPERSLLFSMPIPRVMLSGLFRFSLVYIAVIFSILEFIYPDPEEIIDWFTRGPLKPLTEIATASPILTALSTVVIAAFFAWATGILVNFNHYYNFHLWLEENDKLHKRHGLLTVSERTIPLEKVQALIVRSNPLMRFFGWYRLELQTMGLDVREQGHQVAIPFAQLSDIEAIANHIRPFTLPEHFSSVSRLTIRRTFFRYSLALSAATLAAAYFWPPALWAFCGLPVLFGLAYLQYRYHKYAVDDGTLFVWRGVFRQHLWVLPIERFQVFYAEATVFQRRLDLASLQLDTAGASPMSYPEIVDLPSRRADRLLGSLYETFQHAAPSLPHS